MKRQKISAWKMKMMSGAMTMQPHHNVHLKQPMHMNKHSNRRRVHGGKMM